MPMCRRLIDRNLLTRAELHWLNEYHAEVREKTAGFFEGGGEEMARVRKWLVRETEVL